MRETTMTIPASHQAPPKILVVEDDYLLAESVCDLVRDCGYSVAGKVGRVEGGIRFVNENRIDGAVIDIKLHGADCFPICDLLDKRDIPFFFVSGYDNRLHLPARYSAAVMLPKPIDYSRFRIALAHVAHASERKSSGDAGRNAILGGLAPEEWASISPFLERVELRPGQILESPATPVAFVYFPVSGLTSILMPAGNDRMLEVGQVRRDGMTGLGVVLGRGRPPAGQAVVQIGGEAWRCRTGDLLAQLEKNPKLHAPLLNAVYGFISQMSKSAVMLSNATVEARLATWLVSAARHAGDQPLRFSHHQLASMLAVRRAGVTTALHVLEGKGYIRSTRNLLRILDLTALERVGGSVSRTRPLPR
jgi:CRP-like cAMP-binding protein/CheY-like chemotaxis protein